MQYMQLIFNKATLLKFFRLLKWSKVVAQFAALGTTMAGAVTAFSGSAATGMALTAAGATTYAVTNGMPVKTYEKTAHIPPARADRTMSMLLGQKKQEASLGRGKPLGTVRGRTQPVRRK